MDCIETRQRNGTLYRSRRLRRAARLQCSYGPCPVAESQANWRCCQSCGRRERCAAVCSAALRMMCGGEGA